MRTIIRTSNTLGDMTERSYQINRYLHHAGEYGCTWQDIADRMGTHHGTASGALSVMHKNKEIARLKDKRNGSSIYVLPQYVKGRATSSYRSSAAKRALLELVDQIEADLDRGDYDAAYRHLQETRDKFSD